MRLRLGSRTLVTRWIVITIAASLVAVLDGGYLAQAFALVPERIWRGEIWRLVSWPLIELGPMSLVLTCVAVYKFGGELATRWGDRRLARFMFELVLVAGVATCVLAAIAGQGHVTRLGGWAVGEALVIAWARQFPNATLILYGVLTLHGRNLIAVTIGVAVLFALYLGPVAMAPELVACVFAASYPPRWLHR